MEVMMTEGSEAEMPKIPSAADFAQQHKKAVDDTISYLLCCILKKVQQKQEEALKSRKASLKFCLAPVNKTHQNDMPIQMWQIHLLMQIGETAVTAWLQEHLENYDIVVHQYGSNGIVQITVSWAHCAEMKDPDTPSLKAVS